MATLDTTHLPRRRAKLDPRRIFHPTSTEEV
jgi:hypothetical protein